MYYTDNARSVPQILARETIMAGRSGLFEKPFTPELRLAPASPIVTGIKAQEIPPLQGHVIASAKPLADVPLVRVTKHGADPILAHWQVGLGRVVAFTGGMWPRWGPDWVSWPGFPKLWSQIVRWAASPADSGHFDVQTSVDGDWATVILTADDPAGMVRGGLRVAGRVVRPDHVGEPLDLRQTGAGQFEGTFPVAEAGSYIVRAAYTWQEDGEPRAGQVQACVCLAYGTELRDLRSNEEHLLQLARATGGRLLYAEHPQTVFEPASIRPVQTRRSIWDLLVRIALAVFLADVAVRRLAIDPVEVTKRLRRAVSGLGASSSAKTAPATLAKLKDVRRHLRRDDRDAKTARPEPAERSSDRGTVSRPVPRSTRTRSRTTDQRAIAPEPPDSGQTVDQDTSLESPDPTSRLLRAKQRARRRADSADGGPAET